VRAANEQGNIDSAETLIERASSLASLDIYSRFLTGIELARMNALLSKKTSDSEAEKVRDDFQNILGKALNYGRSAVSIDNGNYQNWLSLGGVYEAVVPLKIEGAYEAAKGAYNEALARNPKSPAILLALARLEAVKGDGEKAREFITKSLQMKSNYTEAVFLLSQIEVQEGNIKAAIQSVEAAAVLSPRDPTIRFQLGLLKYNQKDWSGAANAFESAVLLNQNYANAKYFLGLVYDKLGKEKEAIALFEELAKTNSGNEEIALVLKNLKAGKSPFANAEPPVDSKPEKRSKLPVGEE
jgi:tetratricopeptide (TPR) repeat protein